MCKKGKKKKKKSLWKNKEKNKKKNMRGKRLQKRLMNRLPSKSNQLWPCLQKVMSKKIKKRKSISCSILKTFLSTSRFLDSFPEWTSPKHSLFIKISNPKALWCIRPPISCITQTQKCIPPICTLLPNTPNSFCQKAKRSCFHTTITARSTKCGEKWQRISNACRMKPTTLS